ncbi:zinc finger protein 260-like isoform X2 [Simochromis diagramma]|uniref:zinc finger protein 260-like isoform X2 n=1 Tax=Simochromis diagramma TaxID=43689 RepID=UPI001A7ECCE3|nr:zinc finger protein 260-like isoform X2 [Simochromis diagramma]
MSENLVFYSETKCIMETVIRVAVDVIGNSKVENDAEEQTMNRKLDFDSTLEMLACEATRKISTVFSQVSLLLLAENRTLKAKVGQLESELKTVTESFENARVWRENVLNGCPVLFKQSGQVFTLKPLGKLNIKTDKVAEGGSGSSPAPAGIQRVGHICPPASAAPPGVQGFTGPPPAAAAAARVQRVNQTSDAAVQSVSTSSPAAEVDGGHDADSSGSEGGEAMEELMEVVSLPGNGPDATADCTSADSAEPEYTESQKRLEAEVLKKGRVFVCDICNKTFNRLFHLMKHMNTHKEQRPFTCDQCPRKFRNAATFEYHLLRHEEKKYASYECELCQKKFKTKMGLKTHQVVHTDERPFACSTCGKGFKTKYSLKSHQLVHTAEKPHKCSECGESFKYAFTLQCHRSIHTGEHPYKCTVCGKVFIKRRSLRTHQAVHRGKMFTCETCGAGFTLPQNLKRHMHIHTGERPFKCKVCGKGFIQANKLKAHMLLHGASKPYMCDLCGKTFLYNCHLRRHQSVTHDEKHGQVMRRREREQGQAQSNLPAG